MFFFYNFPETPFTPLEIEYPMTVGGYCTLKTNTSHHMWFLWQIQKKQFQSCLMLKDSVLVNGQNLGNVDQER